MTQVTRNDCSKRLNTSAHSAERSAMTSRASGLVRLASRRGGAILTLAAVAAGALATTSIAHPAVATAGTTMSHTAALAAVQPTAGAWFGSSVPGGGASSRQARVATLEAEAGHRLDVVRIYDYWDDRQPEPFLSWVVATHRIPVLSIVARRAGGTWVPWASIAQGREDAAIRAQAAGVRSLNGPVMIAFNHEPEVDRNEGTPADFVAAWRHFVDVFRAEGATNAVFTWIIGSSTFQPHAPVPGTAFYPGDDYVDWVGGDGYNWAGCRPKAPSVSWQSIFQPFYSFAVAHHKPAIAAEFGLQYNPADPSQQLSWFDNAVEQLQQWPDFKAISYFNSSAVCDWIVDRNPTSTAAWHALGTNPYFADVTSRVTPARIYGADRIGTAIATSRSEFSPGAASSVVLARSDAYPDAVVGGPLAAADNGPILLTPTTSLPSATLSEIERVLPSKSSPIYVLGGTGAISPAVVAQLGNAGYHNVVRLGGDTRYDTATRVADALGDPHTVFLATGEDFPDALSAGPAVAQNHGAILLTTGSTLGTAAQGYLAGHAPSSVVAVGTPACHADASARCVGGSDRYATSRNVAQTFFSSPKTVAFATGLNFPDALSATPDMAHRGGPIVLVPGLSGFSSTITAAMQSYFANVGQARIYGGSGVVNAAAVILLLKNAVGPN